jgi:hypothetical protein
MKEKILVWAYINKLDMIPNLFKNIDHLISNMVLTFNFFKELATLFPYMSWYFHIIHILVNFVWS